MRTDLSARWDCNRTGVLFCLGVDRHGVSVLDHVDESDVATLGGRCDASLIDQIVSRRVRMTNAKSVGSFANYV